MKPIIKYAAIGILIILLVVIFSSNNMPIVQIYPKNDSIITERQPIFEWVGKSNKLILDDNDEFVSPIVEDVKGNSYQVKDKLNFSTYYWKLIGEKNSSVWQFRIDSVVALELKNNDNLYNITNIGNTDLDVEVVDETQFSEITGFVLKLNESKQFRVKNKTITIGEQR